MGLFSAMLAANPREEAPFVETWSPNSDEILGAIGPESRAGRRVTPDIAMQFSAVYACVNLLAKTIASLPLRMYRTDRATGKSFEAPEHPLNDLLEFGPNRWQTAWDFWAMLVMHLLLRGNAYAEIIAGPRGFADRLEPIHPDRVAVERLDDGSLRYRINDYKGRTRFLLQDEILHIRTSIAPGLVGISPIAYARETIGLALATEEHGARLFSNGARPSGVVTVPKTMSDPAFERFKKEWTGLYSGLQNSSKTPILEDGAKFEAISLTAEDAQFLATRQHQIAEMCRWYDVPPVMLHHMTGTSVWGTGVEALMLAFVRNNLNPWLACITQAVRRDLILAPQIYSARFDIESLQRGDSKAQAEFFSRLVLNGILTRNEARDALGYNPLAGLDEPLTPTNTTTSDNLPGNGGGGSSAAHGDDAGDVHADAPDTSEEIAA
ncbi:phage portal protein [Hansschlegelia plantiphila]|uniref:Portal protein n=1 Tax=Hansschlegelia plantiphila TaxID=374655 RepID=A0A9W6MUJ7_9HYPH|nr:phage portal protein [Hansschlegelia plantiphila]GLK67017.1 portal protein [Hansschlegelia plantiphila]